MNESKSGRKEEWKQGKNEMKKEMKGRKKETKQKKEGRKEEIKEESGKERNTNKQILQSMFVVCRSYELTRKDRLYQNIQKMQHSKVCKFGTRCTILKLPTAKVTSCLNSYL